MRRAVAGFDAAALRTAFLAAALTLVMLVRPGMASAEVAAAEPIDAAMRTCLARADRSSTLGQVQCMEAARNGWQSVLDQASRQLRSKLPAARQRAWEESQQRWLAWRKAEAPLLGAVFAMKQGTVYTLVAADMKLQAVRERALLMRRAVASKAGWPRYRTCSADVRCQRVSADVNRTYRRLRMKLPATARAPLARAEQAWKRYRDATGHVVDSDTRNDLVGARLVTLRRLLDAARST
ncbi:lysozyme inhibitor LprI family protein [Paraburkholderia hayleyella]|uniref:lysozyme inhibitor LprI family protein n=1 Tax=Paraburkholderia hayleyella TaxID=2152889 RepID=UPI0012917AF5|nr:lysozyme inhibitor LprI family protein [Paraburkholderia hayleyella]